MDQSHPILQHWFSSRLGKPTKAQLLDWPLIANGDNTLPLAPTGSGKTLAAFLVAIDRLMFGDLSHLGSSSQPFDFRPATKSKSTVRVLYISPLKTLAVDVEKNLHRPLAEITQAADESNAEYHGPTIPSKTWLA